MVLEVLRVKMAPQAADISPHDDFISQLSGFDNSQSVLIASHPIFVVQHSDSPASQCDFITSQSDFKFCPADLPGFGG